LGGLRRGRQILALDLLAVADGEAGPIPRRVGPVVAPAGVALGEYDDDQRHEGHEDPGHQDQDYRIARAASPRPPCGGERSERRTLGLDRRGMRAIDRRRLP
jgi:hypothetical protein